MKYSGFLILAAVLQFCFCSRIIAQKNSQNLITGDFSDLTISEFTQAIEKQTDYFFYYDESQFDSFRISVVVNHEALSAVLDMAFNKTDYLFSIDREDHVFLTKKILIRTNLTTDSASQQTNTTNTRVESDNPEKAVPVATLENKLYLIGNNNANNGQSTALLSGYVRDTKSGEPMIGVSIYIEKPKIGVVTDQYGQYAITLPKGRQTLNIQSIGMKDTKRQILLSGDGKLNIDLQTQVMMLKTVNVSAEKLNNVRGLQMGVQKLDIKAIKQVPVVFGEPDLVRVLLTLPGVQSVGEASTGLNVRGGSADQNLILFNDATIFNPSHFFGLFSVFNTELVKNVELYKSSIPAKFGGRLSSVLDINGKEGNKKDFSGSAGIGLVTSRIDFEGPIVKDKTSFILGARSTYANWLLNLLPDQYKNSKASFYDVNLGISHQINKKNNLYFTAYTSHDKFNLNNDTVYGYRNLNFSLKWKHVFNDKFYGVFITGYDRYQYDISSESNKVNAYNMSFDVNQTNLKAQFNYYLSSAHTLDFGFSSIYYKLHPGSYEPVGSQSLVEPDIVPAEQALESAIYVSDHYTVSSHLAVEAGIRYALYNYLGPHSVNVYAPGLPKTEDNITGVNTYSGNQVINTYSGPEYRVSARFQVSTNFSLKAGYNTQSQYIQVISNTTAMAPTDIWKLADPNIKPERGDQFSFGIYKNLKSNTIEASIEVYYKNMQNILDYKSGAVLILNHHIETDVINTKGKAYGIEFMVKKLTGKLNGWVSYTYSRSFLKQDDIYADEIINQVQFYPTNYDQPSEATLVGNYRINHRFSISINGIYSTGRPITLPIGVYYYDNAYRTLYANRNSSRIPNYFRTDFSMNIDGNHKVHQKFHNSWTIGVYNLTGRKNPYSVYYTSENGVINGYQLSIFGSAIPYVNFNIKF